MDKGVRLFGSDAFANTVKPHALKHLSQFIRYLGSWLSWDDADGEAGHKLNVKFLFGNSNKHWDPEEQMVSCTAPPDRSQRCNT